jgi:DNA-binding XRE family transcriptional regulator
MKFTSRVRVLTAPIRCAYSAPMKLNSVNGLPGMPVERAKKRVTARVLADYLGVTPEHLSGVENGNRPASLTLAVKAAKFLACTVDDLLKNYQEPN